MSKNFKIGIIGSAQDPVIIDVCERIALRHDGLQSLSTRQTKLNATCADGANIESFRIEYLRGPKMDEVWIQTEFDLEQHEDLVLPLVSGNRKGIHFWKELYNANNKD